MTATISRIRMLSLMLLLALAIAFTLAPVSTEPLYAALPSQPRAESWILMDADTGQILLEKAMHAQHKPASITKIMTTLLALESGAPDDAVTVSRAAVAANPSDGSSAGLMPGEIIPLDEILYAVMLESANEAANAVAEFVSGSMEEFALQMNKRAMDLGARNTHFLNANGLNEDGHYTSTYDMALITREAIRNPRFLRIWNAYQHILEPTNLQELSRILNNKNRMLTQGSLPYDGILGGKTGYTLASLNTLVEAATRDGRTLICVLLRGPSALANFQDAKLLLDYGFEQFRTITTTDPDYEDSYSYLLHREVEEEDVRISYGQEVENSDGSLSVSISLTAPMGSQQHMYREIGTVSLRSPTPAYLEQEPLFLQDTEFAFTFRLSSIWPFSMIAALYSSISRLPVWLSYILNGIVTVFLTLFSLACVFRTRRWYRRRKRRQARDAEEARRQSYREQQQSNWS